MITHNFKSNRFIIIVLVYIGLLFAVSVALGFRTNNKMTVAPETYKPGGWLIELDKWLAPFAASVEVDQLKFGCSHRGRTLTLDDSLPSCQITVSRSDQRLRAGILRIKGPGASVEVIYRSLNNAGSEPVNPEPFELNENNPTQRLAVYEAGAVLDFRCLNCSANASRKARIEIAGQ